MQLAGDLSTGGVAVVLAIGVAGCHLLTGVTDLEADGSSGGASQGGGGAGASGAGPSGGGGASASGGGGAGGAPECEVPDDCPGGVTACEQKTCESGACGRAPLVAGTPCAMGGGVVCDGDGECVECVTVAECDPLDVCVEDACVPGACLDGSKDGLETDVDCGGAECPACANGDDCEVASDCTSGLCDATLVCAPCATDADCGAGYCDPLVGGGSCSAKKALGDTCAGSNECLSGACPLDDGVCCDGPCDLTCEACVAAKTGGADGTCALVDPALDADPDGECPDEGAPSCGSNGTGCTGTSNACTLYDDQTACATDACVGTTETHAALCDGMGACLDTPIDCAPYACGATTCLSACSDDLDCAADRYCQAPTCGPERPNGYACGAGADCQSGNCVDQVCCEASSCGACQACSAALTGGTDGTCALVLAYTDPHNNCAGQQVCTPAGTCSFKPNGVACTSNGQCQSTDCVDGFCCGDPCNGTCEACSSAFTGSADGTCAPVLGGLDPHMDCNGGETCDGTGSCN